MRDEGKDIKWQKHRPKSINIIFTDFQHKSILEKQLDIKAETGIVACC